MRATLAASLVIAALVLASVSGQAPAARPT